MVKKYLSVIVAVMMFLSSFPAFSADDGLPYVSAEFSKYAENETKIDSITSVSGVDTRVITDEGSKVLFSRAYGDSVLLKAPITGDDDTKTVMSVRVKTTGGKTTGKLFNAVFANSKFCFISIYDDNTLRLSDGKIVGSLGGEKYRTITIAVDWGKKIYDVYIDGKNKASSWPLPAGSYSSVPQSMEWQLDWNEKEESMLYIDDVRIYGGKKLPWERKFPSETLSTEVLEFTPTTQIDTSAEVYTDIDFGSKVSGMSVTQKSNGGTITTARDDDGLTAAMFYADAKSAGGSYMDITNNNLKSVSKYVVDIRIKINSLSGKGAIGLFDTKDKDNVWQLGYDINAGGTIVSHSGGASVGKIPVGEWTRVSFARNILAGKTDVYVNGVLTGSHTVKDDYYPVVFRIDLITSNGGSHDVMYDWVRIYSGGKLRDDIFETSDEAEEDSSVSVASRNTIMDPQAKLDAALNGKTVFMLENDTMYIDGERQSYANESYKPYIINGNLMMPQNMFSLLCDKEVKHDTQTGEITIGGSVVMKVGETNCTIYGKEAVLNAPPVYTNEILYFPLRSIAEQILQKEVTWDGRGFVVIADEKVPGTGEFHYLDRYIQWHPIDMIYRYMCFDFPKGKTIVDDLIKNFPDKTHPRIMYTNDDIDYILDKTDSDPEWKKAYDYEIRMADSYLARDFSANYTVANAGKQSASGAMQTAIEYLALAYQLTGDTKYADKGIEIMKGYCSWDNMAVSTSNLTSGAWAGGIGVGFDSFYTYMLSSEQGKKDMQYIKDSVKRLVYNDHINTYEKGAGHGWVVIQDNFIGVCGGGMLTLCLAMADEEDMRADSEYLLENIYRSLANAASLFYPNGGYYESVNYSNYLFDNFSTGLNAMFNCCGTDYGLGNAKGFTEAGEFFNYVQSTDMAMGFHDGGMGYCSNPVREFFGYRYGKAYGAQLGRQQKLLGNHFYDIRSLFFYNKAMDNAGYIPDVSDAPLDYYFYGAETGAFRNSHSVGNPVFFGFHGGWTNIVHDMLDLGSFIFESDNVAWATDLGSDSYSLPDYFGKGGYKLYRKRPEGENCIVLNPSKDPDTYFGQELGVLAKIVDLDMHKPRGAKMAYDLTDAYARDAEKYIRGFYFGDNRNTLIVQDELKLKGDTELYWFMHTTSDIEITDNTKARFKSGSGATLTVDVFCDAPGYELKVMKAQPLESTPKVDGQNPNDSYRKLAIHIPKCSGDVNISVKLSPDSGDYVYTPLEFKPISEWTIPEGEIAERPRFEGIYADGELLKGFMPGATRYTIDLPYGTETVPRISAEAEYGNLEVVQAKTIYDKAYVTLRADGFKDLKCEISFEMSKDRQIYVTEALVDAKPVVGQGGELIKPLGASAFTTPEPANSADKMLDGDFDSRATQDGTELWYEFDFGEVKDISGVSMAFYDGNARSFLYQIWYSQDGINFTHVFTGQSTGTTNDWESLAIPGKVRYIRYVGYGNTSSKWNSITEFRAYK